MPDIVNEEKTFPYASEGGAIPVGYLVMNGTADATTTSLAQAKLPSGANVECLGVVVGSPNTGAGDRIIVCLGGFVRVKVSTTVSRGQKVVSSGSDGRAGPAAPSAGANAFVLGTFMADGVANDLVSMQIERSVMQGA